jgi:hypothetical protein
MIKASSLILSIGIIVLLYVAISTPNGVNTIPKATGWSSMSQQDIFSKDIASPFNSDNITNTSGLNSLSSADNNTSNNASSSLTTTTPTTTTPTTTTTTSGSATNLTPKQSQQQQQQQTNELKKKIQASIPTYLILVNLNMPNKNTTDYGVIDLTVTLNNATKVKSFNSTNFSGDQVVMPFRFNAKSDNAPIQINDKFNMCASGEFLAAAVCDTGTIKATNPPLTKGIINLG